MTEKVRKPFLPVVFVIRILLKRYLTKRYDFIMDKEILSDIKPPFLVLANHVNNWDPFFVSMPVKQPVQFVTSDNYFRKKYLKFLLIRVVGAIPKVKSMTDSQAVKNIIRVRNQGGVIGIFPEGNRTWDGDSLPSIYSTAKLVKLLRIPVVFVKIKGGHLAFPRWAVKTRRGKIELCYTLMLTEKDIKEMNTDQIHAAIEKALQHNEYAYQKDVMNPYDTAKRAECLELMLFICPHCNKIGTLVSKENDLHCTHCNYAVHYTKYGFFEPLHGDLHFDNPADWNKWQIEKLYKMIDSITNDKDNVFEDHNSLFFKGKKTGGLKKISTGRLNLTRTKLIFIPGEGSEIEWEIEKISGINVQSNKVFEFYYEDILYRFGFKTTHISSYKWYLAVQYIKSKEAEATNE